jgi:hypothetical protein
MTLKKDQTYFAIVDKVDFNIFMNEYWTCVNSFNIHLSSIMLDLRNGKKTPKAHHERTRALSINVEKFSKLYRKRTIEMDKKL